MNARKRIGATLAMLAAAATLSLTTAGAANAETVSAEANVQLVELKVIAILNIGIGTLL